MDDFAAVQSNITASLVATTRTATALATSDLPFHRSLDASLASALDRQNARLLALAQRLLGSATATSAMETSTVRQPRLSDIEAVEGNWRQVVDVVDSLLERADTALDEFTGAVKRLSPGAEGAREKVGRQRGVGGVRAAMMQQQQQQEIEKPQLKFAHVPRNDERGVFAPLLERKPHAKADLVERKEGEHPYRKEIEEFLWPDEMYEQVEPIPYRPFGSTTATFVDTEEGMYEMLEGLKQAKEVAVDLEHHDQRSYIGIVCLMQISTRDKDWIVDTLKPWRRKLSALNEVFANPAIIKVLHGAYMDVVWLQRDLGLYLVGLFDTHYASRALGYTGGSLAFLLKKFANVDAQKQYQMADWRVRPLPQELFDYARSDTHYLLYIYDNMRNELIQRSDFDKPDHEGDKLRDVLLKSSETALQVYEHPTYDTELGQGPVGWYKLLARTSTILNKEQFSVFRAVHKWRDDVAREQDDSPHYVLPNHAIFSLARSMPATKAEVLNTAHPATQTLRLRADEVVSTIWRAKDEGKDGPEMLELLSKVEPQIARKAKPTQASPSNLLTPYLPRVTPIMPAVTSALALRSATSTFWGSTMGHEQRRSVVSAAAPAVQLTIPLPPLTAEIFAETEEAAFSTPARASTETATPLGSPEAVQEEEDIFILKQLGKNSKKRKYSSSSDQPPNADVDGMAANVDTVALVHDPEIERAQAKAERKKARKEAKRAAKAAGQTNGSALDYGEPQEEEEAFDYENAPSVLNPRAESREQMKERRKREVNPYRKSLDAPKGLGRVQRERAGRSGTFKS